MTNAQPGWYPDPAGDTGKLRYWDGTQWTDHLAEPQPAPGAAGTADAAVLDLTLANAMIGAGTDYASLKIVDELDDTQRGAGGFGSTGK